MISFKLIDNSTVYESENQFSKADFLERETRFELATPTLARLCSTN